MKMFLVVMSAAVVAVGLMVGGCGDDNAGGGGGYTGKTVKIGNLTWMAENLNIDTENSWCYDNDPSNCVTYGRLYTWDAARNACPSGWRLPDTSDWNKLFAAVGGNPVAGTKLKSKSPDWDGNDDFGFSALPGGRRSSTGDFMRAGNYGDWWSATDDGIGRAWTRSMGTGSGSLLESNDNAVCGLSVRCVR